jgi:hypothetical protein
MDIIAAAQANAEKGDSDDGFDPESVIRAANEEASEEDSGATDSGFNPDDVIKD